MEVRPRRYTVKKDLLLSILCIVFIGVTCLNYRYAQLISIEPETPIVTDFNKECFKARANSVAKSRHGRLNYPFINLGMPKIGSSSIHSFFGCAGYRSSHYRCSRTTKCSDCIRISVQEGLKPLHHCILAEAYSQIDDGRSSFPQVDYLEQLVQDYPNATFLLAFRDMNSWFKSLSKWTRNGTRMDHDLMNADIEGLPSGIGSNVHEFSSWFCNHVTRVRDTVSRHQSATLVEIDIEEEAATRLYLSDVFDVEASCWGRANANLELHPELSSGNTVTAEGQSKWFLPGNYMIRSRDGSMRKRNYPGQQFPGYS